MTSLLLMCTQVDAKIALVMNAGINEAKCGYNSSAIKKASKHIITSLDSQSLVILPRLRITFRTIETYAVTHDISMATMKEITS